MNTLLRLDSGSVRLLLQEPGHAALHALLQRPQRLVPEHPLGLGDVEVARLAGDGDLCLGEGGRALQHGAEDLAQHAEHAADLLAQRPDALVARLVPRGGEDGARKVPEVDGGVVGDEEDLAVDALVVERDGGRGSGGEEQARGEEVGVGDVADVGEVEEIGVVADLDLVLSGLVGVVEAGEGLDVALAEDGRGADGCR